MSSTEEIGEKSYALKAVSLILFNEWNEMNMQKINQTDGYNSGDFRSDMIQVSGIRW